MKISTKGRYAIRVLADLATHSNGKNISIREIAERQDISDKYLEGIVARLSAAGFVKSVRGKYGGYQLTRKPEEYSLYDILCATEDSVALVACLEEDAEICPHMCDCQTLPLWNHMQQYIRQHMEEITLEDVLNKSFDK